MPYKPIGQDALPSGYVSQLTRFPWYDSSRFNQSSADLELCSLWWQGQNAFMLVKADVALTVGQLVSWALPVTGAATTNTASPATYGITWDSAAFTAQAEVDNYVYLAGASGGATIKKVISNTTTNVYFARRSPAISGSYGAGGALADPSDGEALAASLATGVATMIRPGHVIVATGTTGTTPAVGVALGTVTQYYYTMVQVAGLAMVSCVGNGTALAVGVNAVPSTAGVAIGSAATGLYQGAGTIMPQVAYAGSGAMIPCFVNLIGNL
jgi:hypothetical protein